MESSTSPSVIIFQTPNLQSLVIYLNFDNITLFYNFDFIQGRISRVSFGRGLPVRALMVGLWDRLRLGWPVGSRVTRPMPVDRLWQTSQYLLVTENNFKYTKLINTQVRFFIIVW